MCINYMVSAPLYFDWGGGGGVDVLNCFPNFVFFQKYHLQTFQFSKQNTSTTFIPWLLLLLIKQNYELYLFYRLMRNWILLKSVIVLTQWMNKYFTLVQFWYQITGKQYKLCISLILFKLFLLINYRIMANHFNPLRIMKHIHTLVIYTCTFLYHW